MKANRPTTSEAQDQAELLAGDRHDEIGMGVGQDCLDPAFAGAAAEQPAVVESLQRRGHLIAVAGRRIEEAVDAAATWLKVK